MGVARVTWRKSSHSATTGGECVEVAAVDGFHEKDGARPYLLRDSKRIDGPVVAFTPSAWAVFLDGLKKGSFD